MKFQLHKIIDYAVKKSAEIEKAKKEFFNGGYVNDESTRELFIEWLIFDFKQASGVTFTAEYILKNPDNLPESTINGFRQIHETQVYSEFQISSVKPGNYLDLNDILTSKKYRVYDKLGSNNSQNKGLLRTRIAQVEGKWFIVGSNPIYIPIVYTPRMKKIIRKEKFLRVTIQDTAELLSKQSTTPSAPPKLLTSKELKTKLSELKIFYNKALIKNKANISFSLLASEIYNENRVNVLDFWQNLTKKGLTNEFIVNEISLMQDLWNYLPHKCLNGKSPYEMFHLLSKQKKSRKLE